MFDINAPIERQFTRDGRKVTFVAKCGAATDYPVAAHIEGEGVICVFTEDGKLYHAWESGYDLVTHPEVVADVVRYLPVSKNCIYEYCPTLLDALNSGIIVFCFAVLELRYNPATLTTSNKVVWTPEGRE